MPRTAGCVVQFCGGAVPSRGAASESLDGGTWAANDRAKRHRSIIDLRAFRLEATVRGSQEAKRLRGRRRGLGMHTELAASRMASSSSEFMAKMWDRSGGEGAVCTSASATFIAA